MQVITPSTLLGAIVIMTSYKTEWARRSNSHSGDQVVPRGPRSKRNSVTFPTRRERGRNRFRDSDEQALIKWLIERPRPTPVGSIDDARQFARCFINSRAFIISRLHGQSIGKNRFAYDRSLSMTSLGKFHPGKFILNIRHPLVIFLLRAFISGAVILEFCNFRISRNRGGIKCTIANGIPEGVDQNLLQCAGFIRSLRRRANEIPDCKNGEQTTAETYVK